MIRLLCLLVSWLLLRPLAPSGRHSRATSRTRPYALDPRPSAPAPSRIPDHPAFCEVAERHADRWPEVRHVGGELPYVAADRPQGIAVASDDLDMFDAALGADLFTRPRIVPRYFEAYEKERDMDALRTELAPLIRQAIATGVAR